MNQDIYIQQIKNTVLHPSFCRTIGFQILFHLLNSGDRIATCQKGICMYDVLAMNQSKDSCHSCKLLLLLLFFSFTASQASCSAVELIRNRLLMAKFVFCEPTEQSPLWTKSLLMYKSGPNEMSHLTLLCSSPHAAAFFDTYKHGFYKINTQGKWTGSVWGC